MNRKLKIYEQSMGGGNYTPVPTILLKGKWLEQSGFKPGEYVEVVVEGDKITLSKRECGHNLGLKYILEG